MELSNHILKIYSQEDIIIGIKTAFEEVKTQIEDIGNSNFNATIENKWSIAENFEHLIISAKPVASALKLPKLTFKAFGTPNRPSEDFKGLVQKYQNKLNAGGKASGKYIPKENTQFTKNTMLENWVNISQKFGNRIIKWSEKDLDSYLMPHPLIGKITVREMLFFTIYHTYHHLDLIKKLIK